MENQTLARQDPMGARKRQAAVAIALSLSERQLPGDFSFDGGGGVIYPRRT
jgi:hypothetical protein